MPDPTVFISTTLPTMSNQHRATPPQWADQERRISWLIDDAKSSCILELRAHVEALEAAANDRQQDQDAECAAAPSPAPSLVDRVALELMNPPLDEDDRQQARAAICAVAAWLRENDAECNMGGDAAQAAGLLEMQANQ